MTRSSTPSGQLGPHNVVLSVMEYSFIGGSMGSVVGETIARAVDRSLATRHPLIIVAASGGARMMEGIASLMQLAKISAGLARMDDAKIPYISVMTDPTTGGVTASFAMLGDLNIAEPNALIGFAGPRVIEQTIRQKLPEGFQRSEFLLEHGFLDAIVPRKEMKQYLAQALTWMTDQTSGNCLRIRYPNSLTPRSWKKRAPPELLSAWPCVAPRTSFTTRGRSSSTTPLPSPSSATPTPKNFVALLRVPTAPSRLAFVPSLSPAAATPKTRSPAPSPRASRSMFFSVQASTPLPTATLTRNCASSRWTTPPRSNGSGSCSRSAACPAPANLTYVPVDFERQSLSEQLHSAGFNPAVPTFFAWLGVVPYLTLEAFRSTINFIAAQPHGSWCGPRLRPASLRATLSRKTGPRLSRCARSTRRRALPAFLHPAEMAAELTAFRDIEDIGSSEINARYFANRTDNLKMLGSAGRLLSAWL